jgi:hypothetical protein
MNTARSIKRGPVRCGRKDKVILKSDRVLWLLCLKVFILVLFSALSWPSVLDYHCNEQLRIDCLGQ